MIKSILKKIFPIKVLKNAFLAFNKLKIKTWDTVFFPEKNIPKERFLILEETNPFLDHQVPTQHLKREVVDKLHLWLDPAWRQDQYFLYYKEEAFIDPDYGWAITKDRRLIFPSLGFSRAPHVNKPALVKAYSSRKNAVRLSKIISLRDTGEENYFHFFNDVLAKLFFIEDQGFDLADFTIVVSEKLFNKEFFQFYWKNSHLKDLHWHVQNKEWIHFQEAIFCKPYTHTKKYFDKIIKLAPQQSTRGHLRRIFLTRSKSSLRFIENMEEIKPLLENERFEILDTATMTVPAQIQLFSECGYLIAIHGAGITNVLFRQGNPLTILEIVPPSEYIPFHYIMIAQMYGYHYSAMLGDPGLQKNAGGFRVDTTQLQQMIATMLNDDKQSPASRMT